MLFLRQPFHKEHVGASFCKGDYGTLAVLADYRVHLPIPETTGKTGKYHQRDGRAMAHRSYLSSQKATAAAAATLRESTLRAMGMRTV